MNTQHTPGPWELEDDGDVFNVCADDRIIARVTIRSAADLREDTANAAAIAAAPDLIAACKAAERLAWEVGTETEDGIKTLLADSRGDLYRQLAAALAKAAP